MLATEQIESGSPGESGSVGRAAALPVRGRDSPLHLPAARSRGAHLPGAGEGGTPGFGVRELRGPLGIHAALPSTGPARATWGPPWSQTTSQAHPALDRGEENGWDTRSPVTRPRTRARWAGHPPSADPQGAGRKATVKVNYHSVRSLGSAVGTLWPRASCLLWSLTCLWSKCPVSGTSPRGVLPSPTPPRSLSLSEVPRGAGGGRLPSSAGPGSPRTEPRLCATWQCRRPKGGRSRTRAQRCFSEAGSGTGAALGFLRPQPSGSWGDVTLTGVPATGETSTWQGPDGHSSGRTPSPEPAGKLSSAVLAPRGAGAGGGHAGQRGQGGLARGR